jgi:aldehyde dehydrogenase (NAD+)
MHPLVPAGIMLRHPDRCFIGGKWVAPAGSSLIAVVSPDDEEVVARVAEAHREDVDDAVIAARSAFDDGPWPHLPAAERIATLERIVVGLRSREAELAEAWRAQIGIPAGLSRFITSAGLDKCAAILAEARSFPFEITASSPYAAVALIRREPVGVTAAIAPWNAPFALMVGKVMAALSMGCTVIMKPAPETPLEAFIIAEVAEACELPPGVLNLVCADRMASAHLAAHPGIDKISFTGSTAVGQSIAAACAPNMTRFTLELGGKSAAIVLDDFDIETAGRSLARTITALSGQVCAMTSRVIVSRARHDTLVDIIADEMAKIRIGRSDDPATEMGPIALKRQRDGIEAMIDAARHAGAGRLVCGGGRPAYLPRGFFLQPTLFADVDPGSALAQEEVFGPVLAVIPCADEDEAVRIANSSRFGLNGSIFTSDPLRAYRLACRIRAGNIAQNGLKVDLDLPFGGFKQSGIGREGGRDGLMSYTEGKTLLLDA